MTPSCENWTYSLSADTIAENDSLLSYYSTAPDVEVANVTFPTVFTMRHDALEELEKKPTPSSQTAEAISAATALIKSPDPARYTAADPGRSNPTYVVCVSRPAMVNAINCD